jgi:hypothetical protein
MQWVREVISNGLLLGPDRTKRNDFVKKYEVIRQESKRNGLYSPIQVEDIPY